LPCAAASLLALSTSCGLRLPVEKQPVSRTFTAAEVSEPKTDQPPHVLVWLISDSYHTGMVFPYGWLLESGFIPPDHFPHDAAYVALSWGNRDAYSEQGIDSTWKWMRVLFTPTPSVMELIPMNWEVAEMLPQQKIWRKLVERQRGTALAAFLNGCTRKDGNGRPVVVTRSSWGKGVQLECSHSYFIPRVCNVWTGQAIEAIGGDINPWQAITASSLIRQSEKPSNDFELIWPGGGRPPSPVEE
jgi:hypothetical protein